MKRWVATAAGLLLLAGFATLWLADRDLYYRAFAWSGFKPYSYPFLDWEGVSAFIECWRRGVDVYVTDPCDVRGQLFNYSPLWLEARFIPFGPAWRTLIGLAMDAGFFVCLGFVFRPATWREAALFTLAAVSPMTAFGVERANVDLLMFMLVAVGGLLVAGRRRVGGYGVLLLAGLLKFYPLAALAVAFRERPRVFFIVAGVSACVLSAFVLLWRRELPLVLSAVPHPPWDENAFGAPNLIGWVRDAAPQAAIVGTAMLLAVGAAVLGAAALLRDREAAAALAELAPRDQVLLAAGAAVMLGCFVTGLSGDYRAVFLILVEGGLLAAGRTAPPRLKQRLGMLTLAIPALMWEPALRAPARAAGPLAWLVWWPGHELLWWALAGALAAIVACLAWNSPTVAVLLRRPVRQ